MKANFIFIIYFHNLISSYQQEMLSSCLKHKPFRLVDNTCANFTEICVKSDFPPCENLLNACEQCPPSNFTILLLMDIIKLVKVQLGTTNAVLDKQFNISKDQINSIQKKFESQLFSNQSALENKITDQLNSTNFEINKYSAKISILLWVIICLNASLLMILVLEIRFKLFTKSCECCIGKGRRNNYRILRSRKSEKDKIAGASFKADFGDINIQLEKMVGLDDKLKSQCDELCTQLQPIMVLDTVFKEEISGIRILLEQIIKENRNVISLNTVNFQINGLEELIELFVQCDDNVIKVKRQICAKWMNAKVNDHKIMKLIHNNVYLDNNQYLLPHIGYLNVTINCELDPNISASDIVVLQLKGNIRVPEYIQIYKNQTITELKSIISPFINSRNMNLLKDLQNLKDDNTVEQCHLKDYDWIRVIVNASGELVISSIFDEKHTVTVDYTNMDQVSSIKIKIIQSIHFNPDDLVLFSNGNYLEEDKYLFEIDIHNTHQMKYCRFMSMDHVEIHSDVIVKGDFAEILEGRHRWKKYEMMLKRYQLLSNSNLKDIKALLNELITFQVTKSHPRFVQMFGVSKNAVFLYIEMEKMAGGSIEEFLVKNWPLNENDISKWSKQILEALKYLHSNQITHRDLKPSNILVDSKNDVKLSGFGLSKYLQGFWPNYVMEGFVQSKVDKFRYMAPEVCNNQPYGYQADVWSFGATLVNIVTGKPPYHDKNETDALLAISESCTLEFTLPSEVSMELEDFIRCCLKSDPRNRATVNNLIADAFLKT